MPQSANIVAVERPSLNPAQPVGLPAPQPEFGPEDFGYPAMHRLSKRLWSIEIQRRIERDARGAVAIE